MDDTLWSAAACFGEPASGVAYRIRPGAYAVIAAPSGLVAALATPQGLFLPGGGADPGETPEQTLRREIREECGAAIRLLGGLGAAVEWFYASAEDTYFELRSHFFLAALETTPAASGEADHTLLWLDSADVAARLRRPAQRWAVALACRRSHGHRC